MTWWIVCEVESEKRLWPGWLWLKPVEESFFQQPAFVFLPCPLTDINYFCELNLPDFNGVDHTLN